MALLGPHGNVLLARGALGSNVLTPGNPVLTLERMTQVSCSCLACCKCAWYLVLAC